MRRCCRSGNTRARLVRNGFQQRDALGAAAQVADRVFADHLVQPVAVLELHGQRIGDGALGRIVIVAGIGGILDANDLGAQGVDARIARHAVLVVGGGQAAVQQRHGHHVLDAVVAVGRVVQRTLLVDDADAGLVRADDDAADVLGLAAQQAQPFVQLHRAFHGGLGVELGRIRDLEQHVLHHVAAVGPLELERLALEQHVVEAQVLALSTDG